MRTFALLLTLVGVTFSGCMTSQDAGSGTTSLDASLAQSQVAADAPETAPGEPQKGFDQEIDQNSI